MKKWLGLYIAVCVILLCVLSGAVGMGTAKRASFSMLKEENGSTAQVIWTKDANYVLYREPQQKKFKVKKTGTAANSYRTLDTIYRGGTYYLYSYIKGGKQFFGVSPLAAERDNGSWQALELETEGTALAFGSNEREFICSIQSADGTKITEYALPLSEPAEWNVKAAFNLPENHFAVCGAYEGEDFWFALEDGRVYRRTTVLEPVDEAAEDTLLAGTLDTQLSADGTGAWLC